MSRECRAVCNHAAGGTCHGTPLGQHMPCHLLLGGLQRLDPHPTPPHPPTPTHPHLWPPHHASPKTCAPPHALARQRAAALGACVWRLPCWHGPLSAPPSLPPHPRCRRSRGSVLASVDGMVGNWEVWSTGSSSSGSTVLVGLHPVPRCCQHRCNSYQQGSCALASRCGKWTPCLQWCVCMVAACPSHRKCHNPP